MTNSIIRFQEPNTVGNKRHFAQRQKCELRLFQFAEHKLATRKVLDFARFNMPFCLKG